MNRVIILFILLISNNICSQNTQIKLDFLSVAKSGIGLTIEQIIQDKYSMSLSYQNMKATSRCFGLFTAVDTSSHEYLCGSNSFIDTGGRESYISLSANYYLINKTKHKLALGIFGGFQKFYNYSEEFQQAYFEFYQEDIEEESDFLYGLSILYKFDISRKLALGVEFHYNGQSRSYSSTGVFFQGIFKI